MNSLLLTFAQTFAANREAQPVDGDYYELPGTVVYHTTTQKLPEKSRLEVNTITPEAADRFAWQAEITLNNKVNGDFIHVIIRTDGSAEETYGKTVTPVDAAREREILDAFEAALALI